MADSVNLAHFIEQQLSLWEEPKLRFEALAREVKTRELKGGAFPCTVQWNPSRIVSTKAVISKNISQERPCFLCEKNQVAEQFGISYLSDTRILINPFPILPNHLVVAAREHKLQRFCELQEAFYAFVCEQEGYVGFYNGPRCGASAPDHAHFQGGAKGYIPLQKNYANFLNKKELILEKDDIRIYLLHDYACPVFSIESPLSASQGHLRQVQKAIEMLPLPKDEWEAPFNLLAWQQDGLLTTCLIPRSKHRPNCYAETGERQMLVSPGAIDMGALIIVPRAEDFDKITASIADSILQEVGISIHEAKEIAERIRQDKRTNEPVVKVGIMSEPLISVCVNGKYTFNGEMLTGEQKFERQQDKIRWNGTLYDSLFFTPATDDATFTLLEVTIGVHFHWQQRQAQTFEGAFELIAERDKITVINHIKAEKYLQSVICSEMNASSPIEFLKAHAIISRSWLLNQLNRKAQSSRREGMTDSPEKIYRWYDRDDHLLFDICADDHCQRYQGITQDQDSHILQAIKETNGEVLLNNNEICDARFSKCCGGVTENFSTCWEERDFTYLSVREDNAGEKSADLSDNARAEKWIAEEHEDFCNTQNPALLKSILNSYDQSTDHFYRWTVELSRQELPSLLKKKTGRNFGDILHLIPIERGKGGRIKTLRIEGTKGCLTIGKELEIRRALSPTHLYSSAFFVEEVADKDGIPSAFILHGAGWGHGVGLCQIGAAVMAEKGYDYQEILTHYYKGASIKKVY